jgi:cysteine desulfuration protein SufE
MVLEKIKEMGENLKMLERQERLHYLVDKARQVEPLPETVKTEQNRIHGCASKLWIIGGVREDGTMMYQADGDAFITKGTAKLVTDIVNGEKQQEVAKLTVESFRPLGIKELLTVQRQNGLGELINRIVRIANG